MMTNDTRAEHALAALRAATPDADDDDILEDRVTDLLADLLHACDACGVHADDALRRACGHYHSERALGAPAARIYNPVTLLSETIA